MLSQRGHIRFRGVAAMRGKGLVRQNRRAGNQLVYLAIDNSVMSG